jgi:hypothetical protein
VGNVDTGLAGVGSKLPTSSDHPARSLVSMRPVSVFAKAPGCEIERLRGDLHGLIGHGSAADGDRQHSHSVMNSNYCLIVTNSLGSDTLRVRTT